MAQSHDYIVPRLDGLPYLDKPVVYFAAAAAVMQLVGPTETAVRIPAYLATLATVVLLIGFARRRWGPEAGWLAGLAYATTVLPLAYARAAIFDSTLTLCTTAATVWLFEDRSIRAWAAMAVGALTKGPLALALPLLTLIPHALATGAPVRRLIPWRGLAVFAAIALPWFVAVSIAHPDFPGYVFFRETLARVATPTFHRTAPVWYYLPIVPLAAFPWIVPALGRVRFWRTTWRTRFTPDAREPLFLAAWVLVPLAFFTLNQSKLPQYVLPLMPAFALAATRNLTRSTGVGARAYVAVALVAGLALLAITRWLPAPISLTPEEKAAIPPAAIALGLVVLCSAAVVGLGLWVRGPLTVLIGYAVVVMSIPFLSGRLLLAVGEDRSSGVVAKATVAAVGRAGEGATVLGVFAYPPSLPFYLGRPVAVATATGGELTSTYIADHVDEMRAQEASPLFPPDYWREALARCPMPTVFVTRASNREARATLGAALPLLAADGHYAAYGPCQPHPPGGGASPPRPATVTDLRTALARPAPGRRAWRGRRG